MLCKRSSLLNKPSNPGMPQYPSSSRKCTTYLQLRDRYLLSSFLAGYLALVSFSSNLSSILPHRFAWQLTSVLISLLPSGWRWFRRTEGILVMQLLCNVRFLRSTRPSSPLVGTNFGWMGWPPSQSGWLDLQCSAYGRARSCMQCFGSSSRTRLSLPPCVFSIC